ncbi:hypothetical protein C8R44DRAFT_106876 [Mycena epipterygia]|nr:hypothetical protein C8R44DRAFT_106876 [Mycena epipterygia]
MDTTTTWPRASDRVHNATDGGTDIDTQAMEARIREKVVASRRKPKMTLGENTPCLESTTPCLQSPIPTSPIHLPPFHHHIRGNGDMAQPPPRNPESQDVRSRLAAQQKRLAEEIARAKDRLAQLESLKPKSTTDKRSAFRHPI